jgi:hypothetical protein
MTPEAAEGIAIQALSFIAGDGERLGHFLAATGIGPTEIRAASRQPGFLAGVLAYLASDERLRGFELCVHSTARAFEQHGHTAGVEDVERARLQL